MQTSYIFHPKYGHEIVMKVIACFVDEFLEWRQNGFSWHLNKCVDHKGWVVLEAYPEDDSSQCFTETCFSEDPLTASQLADSMMVLLTEDEVAYESSNIAEGHILYEAELSAVLGALSKAGTRVYSPYGDKVWSFKVGDTSVGKDSKRVSILGHLLTQEAA
jgi:hypothetical protein